MVTTPTQLRRQQFTDPELQRLFDAVYVGLEELHRRARHPMGDVRGPHTSSFVAAFDAVELVDPTAGAIDVTLPVIKPGDVGRVITILNATNSTDTITVYAADGAQVDLAGSVSSAAALSSFQLVVVSRTRWRKL